MYAMRVFGLVRRIDECYYVLTNHTLTRVYGNSAHALLADQAGRIPSDGIERIARWTPKLYLLINFGIFVSI